MASIIDAFQESFNDHHALTKYFIFAIPVYYCVDLYSKNDSSFYGISAIVFILLFGFMLKCTSNVRNSKNYVLPSINIFSMFYAGIKGLIAIGPILAIFSWLAILVCDFLSKYFPDPNSMIVWKIIVWAVFASMMMTGYLCYARNFKISDAYNLKIIIDSCVNVFAGILFMIPQVLIVNAIIVSPVTYLIWLFFGIPHPIAVFFWSMCLIFNLSLMGHYLAQIDYEAIAGDEKDNEKII